MRLTPEKLRAYATRFVDQRSRADLRLLAAYLCGSLRRGQPFLGGAADVDVVLIYNGAPEPEREIVPLPGKAHLDVRRHDRSRYEPARQLRLVPFLGPALFAAAPLYDPQHFLDFAQAAVRSRFRAPETAAARGRTLLQQARDAWFALSDELAPAPVAAYLQTVFLGANAVAALLGYAFSPRRVLLDFPVAAQRWGFPELTGLLFRAVGAPQASPEALAAAQTAWEHALTRLGEHAPPELAPARQPYYRRAVAAYLQSSTPTHALYPLLWTWALALQDDPAAEHLTPWQRTLQTLGLAQHRAERLDRFLDALEEALETWERRQGL